MPFAWRCFYPLLILCLALVLISPSQAVANISKQVTSLPTVPILSGNLLGTDWLQAKPESKLDFCNRASVAFRGSPSQSYIISSNVQSLTPTGLCDRLDQYFSIEENLETRLGSAAGIAPLLFADTPLGTKYHINQPSSSPE